MYLAAVAALPVILIIFALSFAQRNNKLHRLNFVTLLLPAFLAISPFGELICSHFFTSFENFVHSDFDII
jgi:hypothetical protein